MGWVGSVTLAAGHKHRLGQELVNKTRAGRDERGQEDAKASNWIRWGERMLGSPPVKIDEGCQGGGTGGHNWQNLAAG